MRAEWCPRCSRLHKPGPDLTPRVREALRRYAELGDQRLVADAMGLSHESVKTYLGVAYCRLGVNSAVEAFRVMGWLQAPG